MEKKFSFVGFRKYAFIISAVIILAGILSAIFQGFNWDIDFTGGTELYYRTGTAMDRAQQESLENAIETELGIQVSTIQSTDEADEVIIKLKSLTTDEVTKISDLVKKMYSIEEEDFLVSSENVSATVGGELRNKAIIATLIAIALMLIYIAVRFEIRSGLAAVICLAHDVLIMLTAYTILQIPMNTNFIAAVLTIIGYSINACIIVFDRIRENKKTPAGSKRPFGETVDISIRQTITRTVNTTVTTLLTIGMVYILGVISVKEFALPLIVGIISGLYSSTFLSGQIWDIISSKKKA